ncbi:MAG: hypothetical protein RR475_02535 [Clostridia bacterium]
MEGKSNNLLDNAIEKEFQDITTLKSGSAEKVTAIDGVVKLCKLKNEETASERELKLKGQQLSEQVKDRWIKVAIAGAELIIPLIFYAVWIGLGLKFEETGSFTSTTFRGFFSRLKPTKK